MEVDLNFLYNNILRIYGVAPANETLNFGWIENGKNITYLIYVVPLSSYEEIYFYYELVYSLILEHRNINKH